MAKKLLDQLSDLPPNIVQIPFQDYGGIFKLQREFFSKLPLFDSASTMEMTNGNKLV